MGRVADTRYCERGEQCVRYDPQTGKSEKLSRYNTDKICNKCQEAERTAERASVPVPREHEELLRAAKALFDNGIEDVDAISKSQRRLSCAFTLCWARVPERCAWSGGQGKRLVEGAFSETNP
jgi:hypothetical protein